MKLVKLSLIAAMATGIMATTASAVPLEEAIKDVDVSGYTRLRYTHDTQKAKDSEKDRQGKWNFKGELNLKTKIDDNFFAVVGIRYDDTDAGRGYLNDNNERVGTNSKAKNDDFDLHRAYFGYTVGNTVVQVGRQDVGAFFTDDMYGDGIKVLNSDIEGLTLAALWMDSLEDDSDITTIDNKTIKKLIKDSTGKYTTDHNLYGVAAIGSYDPVSFQVWYAMLEDVTDLFAVELATSFDVNDDVNLNAKLQYSFSDFDGGFKNDVAIGTANLAKSAGLTLPATVTAIDSVDDADFYGIELGTEFFGVDFSAGYVDFSTDKNKLSLVSFEDQGSFISPGEELLDYRLFAGKNKYWFVTAGYTIPDTGVRIGVDYLNGKNKYNGALNLVHDISKESSDMSEVVARIEYAHSDKLKFKTWYSHVKRDVDYLGGDLDYKNDRVRFEAKYSF